MRPSIHSAAVLTAAAALVLAAAGCGRPEALIRYTTGGPDETVRYDSATFQLARGERVQIVLFRRKAAPIGTAEADFEYLFLELPERRRYGWLRADRVPAYRWVRVGGEDRLWLATAGQVRMRFADGKAHLHLDFRMTMEPVRDTPGAAYVLEGDVKVLEDTFRTQTLITRYGPWLARLVNPPSDATSPGDAKRAPAPHVPPMARQSVGPGPAHGLTRKPWRLPHRLTSHRWRPACATHLGQTNRALQRARRPGLSCTHCRTAGSVRWADSQARSAGTSYIGALKQVPTSSISSRRNATCRASASHGGWSSSSTTPTP